MPRRISLFLTAIILFTTLVLAGETCLASSLWSTESDLYADRKGRKVGDLVTVIVVERTEATQSATTTIGKDAQVEIGPGAGVLQGFIPLIKAGGGDEVSAKGSTTRGGKLTAKITTQIIDRLANGNLVLEGRQTIVVNGEEQEIIISGIVREGDIAPDNTVLSTYIADAHISFRGNGTLAAKQKPGLLTRLFNWLF